MICDCCQEPYTEDNDLILFAVLKDGNGKSWALCGPCIQVMWQERAPHPEIIPV